jgi:predicted metal-dependent TIM-barrel fold hydrolase
MRSLTCLAMEPDAVVNSFRALMGVENESAEAFVIAAAYACAIHSGESPRTIADRLFSVLPSTAAWPAVRGALVELLEG